VGTWKQSKTDSPVNAVVDIFDAHGHQLLLRRLPENDVPGCAGFWFVFKARQQAHSTVM
jgi:hypothetical protein